MKILTGIFSLFLTYLLVVGLHELGHAVAARIFSIKIQQIALGFGKPLFKFKSRAGYDWIIGRYPVGGYVKLLNTRIHPVPKSQWAHCFDKNPIWIRCIVLISGCIMNGLVAWMCFFGMELIGYQRAAPAIKTIVPNSIAAQAGLRAGDTIIKYNQIPVQSWQQTASAFISTLGQASVPLLIKNTAGQFKYIQLNLTKWKPKVSQSLWGQLGITQSFKIKIVHPAQPPLLAATLATKTFASSVRFFILTIKKIITGKLPLFFLMGPLSFIDLAIHSFLHSLTMFLFFIGTFSLAVGIVNLLPLPGLDGSGILYACVEKIRNKPMDVAWEILLYQLTMILFWMLLAQLVANDLQRIAH